jgi:hypothetical protein
VVSTGAGGAGVTHELNKVKLILVHAKQLVARCQIKCCLNIMNDKQNLDYDMHYLLHIIARLAPHLYL